MRFDLVTLVLLPVDVMRGGVTIVAGLVLLGTIDSIGPIDCGRILEIERSSVAIRLVYLALLALHLADLTLVALRHVDIRLAALVLSSAIDLDIPTGPHRLMSLGSLLQDLVQSFRTLC